MKFSGEWKPSPLVKEFANFYSAGLRVTASFYTKESQLKYTSVGGRPRNNQQNSVTFLPS